MAWFRGGPRGLIVSVAAIGAALVASIAPAFAAPIGPFSEQAVAASWNAEHSPPIRLARRFPRRSSTPPPTPSWSRPDPYRPPTISGRRSWSIGTVAPIAAAATLLGTATTSPAQAKFWLTKKDGNLVLQSNYRPPDGVERVGGGLPDAVLLGSASLLGAVEKALYPDTPLSSFRRGRDSERLAAARRALAESPIYVDASLIGPDGRPPKDLTGAREIRIVGGDGRPLATGGIDVLTGARPPPPLVETLSGCCFKGRPPGKAVEINGRLASHTIKASNTRVVSLVIEGATAEAFRDFSNPSPDRNCSKAGRSSVEKLP